MSPTRQCEICDAAPRWTIRRTDGAMAWSCARHVSKVCEGLQRDWEMTEVVLTDYQRAIKRAGAWAAGQLPPARG